VACDFYQSVQMPKRILHQGKFLRLMDRDTWEYVGRSNASGVVIILAMTKDKKVIFVEQYRAPVASKVIEFPAGLMHDEEDKKHETAAETALRELEEETGFRGREVKLIIQGPVSSGMSSETIQFFLALGVEKKSKGGGVGSEEIITHEVPLDEAPSWLREREKQGYLVDPKVYAGLFFLNEDGASSQKRVR